MNVLTFTPDGLGHALYTEAIDLPAIGPLTLERATAVEFNHSTQEWEVREPGGLLLYTHVSREECLAWEQKHFNQ